MKRCKEEGKMAKISAGRLTALVFFSSLIAGAVFCLHRLQQDIIAGKYFSHPEELRYEIIFLSSYALIILFLLRYGYYLAINKINWQTIKDDFLYLLNKRYFSRGQWIFNVVLFWMAVITFVCSLAISVMKGNL
jgi:hypothetical protein